MRSNGCILGRRTGYHRYRIMTAWDCLWGRLTYLRIAIDCKTSTFFMFHETCINTMLNESYE